MYVCSYVYFRCSGLGPLRSPMRGTGRARLVLDLQCKTTRFLQNVNNTIQHGIGSKALAVYSVTRQRVLQVMVSTRPGRSMVRAAVAARRGVRGQKVVETTFRPVTAKDMGQRKESTRVL